ncbi:hypothetical protein FJT64_022805 [Amphibalanus amphitrite]|uniref:Uncharacterized protein n=1 Tax=Amphibalanus amphitrite TaxID=1232801 RepID=A0A6A4WE01_AMPAM|nr:hypothetical protein FJT64_022805 [Amphibalanus amphitrite]
MDRLTVPQEKKMCRSWSSHGVAAAPVPVLRHARSWGDRPQQAALTSTPTLSPEQMETATAEQLREFERVVAALEDAEEADGGRTPTNADCVRVGVLSQAQRMLDVVVGPQPPPVPVVTLAAAGGPCLPPPSAGVLGARCRRPDLPAAAAGAGAGAAQLAVSGPDRTSDTSSVDRSQLMERLRRHSLQPREVANSAPVQPDW